MLGWHAALSRTYKDKRALLLGNSHTSQYLGIMKDISSFLWRQILTSSRVRAIWETLIPVSHLLLQHISNYTSMKESWSERFYPTKASQMFVHVWQSLTVRLLHRKDQQKKFPQNKYLVTSISGISGSTFVSRGLGYSDETYPLRTENVGQ